MSFLYKISILLSFITLTACNQSLKDPNENTRSPITGKKVKKTCEVPFETADSFRGHHLMNKNEEYVTIQTEVKDGSKRIIRLYNETNCASILDTDYIGKTETYLMRSDEYESQGLQIAAGKNKVNFKIEECTDIDPKNNFNCIDKISEDSGYLIIESN